MRLLAIVVGALALAAPAEAGGPRMLVGAVEDAVKTQSVASSKAQMDLARLAGFNAIRVTSIWLPGETKPAAGDLKALQNAAAAARLDGIELMVSVFSPGGATAPRTDEQRSDFAAYAAALANALPQVRYFIVGNEPNLPRFWQPQFNEDGSDAAAPSYEATLARTYDALHAARKDVVVLGGAVSPRGSDSPTGGTKSHSPTTFVQDLGAAYRSSGRTKPIMDGFDVHPYEENSNIEPVKGLHPNSTTISIGDYEKLEALLAKAFDGSGQRGSTLPLYYGEFGVESVIPAAKASKYSGEEPKTIHPVDERTQGAYYREAVQLAFCQPNVRALMIFHTRDEPALPQWQSGVYYVDGTPKSSLLAVRAAIAEARRGIVARCAALKLTPKATLAPDRGASLRLTCDIDCVYSARAGRRTAHGRAVGGVPTVVRFRKLAPGSYRVALTLVASLNPGPPKRLVGRLTIAAP